MGLVLFRQSPDLELDSRQTLEPNNDPSNPAELCRSGEPCGSDVSRRQTLVVCLPCKDGDLI